MKQIAKDIFSELVKNIKRDSPDMDLQSITFTSKYCGYELNFYAEEDTNYELQVCEFGYTQGSKYYECFLTEEQVSKLQYIIDNEITIIEYNIKIDNLDGFKDSYESTGHIPSDFF